jgi:HlyD family secretion protein
MMKRTALYVILGAVVVLAVVGGFVWRSRSTAQLEEQEVRSAVVERGTMFVAVSASGSIEPQTRVGLAFEVPGQLAEVLVEVGDLVDVGDELARLETRQLALQVQQAQATLALAEAQLAQLQAGPRPAEVAAAEANLQAVQAQLSAAVANRDEIEGGVGAAQIASAEAQVASARLELEVAQDRYDTIAEEGTQKEQANYQLYTAKQAFAAAQAELDKLLAGADEDEVRAARAEVGAASAQRDAAQAQLDLLLAGTPEEQIADAEAQVAQAQAALELAELSLRQAVLRAPFDGIVAGVNISAGERASVGSPAVELLDTSGFRIVVSVDEIDVGRLSEGKTAQVTLDAFPDALITGTVESIASIPMLEGGVVYYDVAIELAPTDVPIRADMTANATIVVEELADVLTIPTWVVRVDRDAGQAYVHRKAGDEVERVDVVLGVRYEGVVQILDGLSEGDEIVWVPESTLFGLREE